MYDDDSLKTDQKEKKKQAAWNRFIEDQAKQDPKVKTYSVRGDIESALGVKKFDGRDDVKPYHLMKLFQEREYDREKLQNICRRIESLF